MAFPEAIAACKMLRPRIIVAEQVPGFPQHAEYRLVMRQFNWAGYRLCWAKTLDIVHLAPVHRARWIAVFSRIEDQIIQPCRMQMWPHTEVPTPRNWDAFLTQPDLLVGTELTEQVLSLASDRLLLPPFKRTKIFDGQVLQSRCSTADMIPPTFLASYGNQHKIDMKWLRQQGLLSHFFLSDEHVPRWFHPLEILILHGQVEQVHLPSDFNLAWRFVGNFISTPHALLAIMHAVNMLPTRVAGVEIADVIQKFLDSRIRASSVQCHTFPRGWIFSKQTTCEVPRGIFDSFWGHISGCSVPDGLFWNFQGWQELQPLREQTIPSQITELDPIEDEEIPNTAYFVPMLKGVIVTATSTFHFWFAADLPLFDLLAVWQFWYQVDDVSQKPADVALRLIPDEFSRKDYVPPTGVLCVCEQGCLTLFPCGDRNLDLVSEQGQLRLFDQFALITGQTIDSDLIITKFEAGRPCIDLADSFFAMTAFMEVEATAAWSHVTQVYTLTYRGTDVMLNTILVFWQRLFPPHVLEHLGLTTTAYHNGDHLAIHFVPQGQGAPIPKQPLKILLTILVFRALFQPLAVTEGSQVLLKWLSRPLWFGTVPGDMKLETIQNVMAAARKPFGGTIWRLVNRAKQFYGDATFQDCSSTPNGVAIVHLIKPTHGGGGGPTTTKGGLKTQTKNAIASALLQEGFELAWISKTLDDVMKTPASSQLTSIAAMPAGPNKLQCIRETILSCDITIPVVKAKASNAPGFDHKHRKKTIMPLPQNYVVSEGQLRCEDDSIATQLTSIDVTQSGFVLLTPQEALPWLRSGDKVATDELAIILFGDPPCDTRLVKEQITLQCLDERERMTLIACTMYQLGEKSIKKQTSDGFKQEADKTCLLAFTFCQEDWKGDWNEICTNPITCLRNHFGPDLLSVWGKSYRNGRQPSTSASATSIQLHATVAEDKVLQVLQKSGHNQIWCIPKGHDGRLSQDWRLVWLDQKVDPTEIPVLAAKIPSAAGLVRIKGKYALRVATKNFSAAWKVLNPGVAEPPAFDTSRTFKLENVPFGTVGASIAAWASHNAWQAKPLRPIGPRAWMVGASVPPPETATLSYNGNPILVKEVTPYQHKSSPILAGPKPRHSSTATMTTQEKIAAGVLLTDPWASWEGPRVHPVRQDPPSRATQGPFEQRCAAQDSRIQQLENTLQDITNTQQSQGQQLQLVQETIVRQDKAQKAHLDSTLQQFRSELDTSFTAALKQQSTSVDESLREIKALLLQTKRKTPEEGDQEMTAAHS
eukprot:Skav221577  [mRNA]  locus=scaffold1376:1142356:1146159:- [translate_table: standard]